ncbi:hypothetical protein [Nannocystis radixulma]|uniref:Uncharacterized protein n=1 Tax=Nannocystis radixulma TaxID=2995305 RepID=A0ABT5BHC1_9BACT|nr:hypothetical protein [Nannocystis radixulma]MDC0673545.1 hypothetical protein [Nannocystis radixulma]
MGPCLYMFLAAVVAARAAEVGPLPTFAELELRLQRFVEDQLWHALTAEGEAAYQRRDLAAWQRRELAFYAVSGYHRLYQANRDVEGLCAARRLLRKVERELGVGEDGPVLAGLSDKTAEYIAQLGGQDPCARPRPRAKVKPSVVPVCKDITVRTEATASCSMGEVPATSPSPPAELPRPAPLPELVPVGRPAPLEKKQGPDAQTVTGGVLTALGTGALAGSAGMLAMMGSHAAQIRSVTREAAADRRPLTLGESQRIDALYDEAMAVRGAAIATGVIGAVSLATGIALLVTRRDASRRLSMRPHGGVFTTGWTIRF